jgi:DnaJ-class molecular chaperone
MSKTGKGELVSEVARLFDGIDGFSYYEFLALRRTCDYIQVKDAFYGRAQRFHPDRFVALEGETVKRAVYAVYKRMTEAYSVLSDPELRQLYDEGLDDRGDVRLPAERRSRRLDAEERQVSNTLARVYLRSGRQKFARGDLNGAWIDVELGLSLEESPPLRDLHINIVRSMAGR